MNVATGEIVGSIHRRHRAAEFKKFLTKLDTTVPADLNVHLVCDNYPMQKWPTVNGWLARHPRFHMHVTPTCSSWLNEVERWFGLLTEKKPRRGTHTSVLALGKRHPRLDHHLERKPQSLRLKQNRRRTLKRLTRYLQRIPGEN
jgi:hypothetical protein